MGGHKLDLHALFNVVLEHQVGLRAFAGAHCPRVAVREQLGAHAACSPAVAGCPEAGRRTRAGF